MGRLRGGVYCFDNFTSSGAQVNVVGLHNLWHGRLGHPLNQVLSLLAKDLKVTGSMVNEGPCDVCFRAKQIRTQFIDSDSHALELFELIHCDICGIQSAFTLWYSVFFDHCR